MTPPPPPENPEGWLRVPIGPEARRWGTIAVERTVLVVVRTLTTFTWILELLPELFADPRVQLVFTIEDNGSAYRDGAVEELTGLGGRIVPWEQALATPFSLAITASPNGELKRLQAPLLILPHGPGYSKHESLPADGVPPIPTIAAASGWRTMLALSHAEQRRRWREDDAAGVRTSVIGDPCIDRLRASAPLRSRYRRALGVPPAKKLVVTSSTWGPGASLAQHPDLPARLLAELPADEYAVAAILHPNIWVGHGPWQVRLWMQRALEAGLQLMPAGAGWQAALVAADLLIGDHGSVSLYGMGLGLPLLFSAFACEEIVADAPLASLAGQTPHLAHGRGLRHQIEQIGFDRDPSRYAEIVAQVFAEPGRALENLRALAYEAIGLEPPAQQPRLLPFPPPNLDLRPVTAQEVNGSVKARSPSLRISIERGPAGLGVPNRETGERHLVIDESEQNQRLHDTAAAVTRRQPRRGSAEERRLDAIDWLSEALDAHPGARVAACALDEDRCAARIRDEPPLEASLPGKATDPGLLASALYVGWVDGSIEGHYSGLVEIVVGNRVLQMHLVAIGGVIPAAQPAEP